jgi:hypothetical protein
LNLRGNIANATAITLVLLMASVMLISNVSVQPAQAQIAAQQPTIAIPSGATPNVTVTTTAQLSFRPNPVGVGEVFLVNMWTTPAIHVERMHRDYTVTITKPDGTKDVLKMNSYCADCTAWFEYIADQVGNWTLKFDFLGEYYPAGQYYNGYIVTNSSGSNVGSAYYKPSSTPEQTLIVQQELVHSWHELPLPTDYWTRPLDAYLNRDWWPIAGNYPDYYFNSQLPIWNQLYPGTNPSWSSNYGFYPWVQGPNSAHIVWKRQDNLAGFAGPDLTLQTTGSATNPTLVYMGRAYATQTVRWYNGSLLSCAICYDLRTGEMYYMNPTAAPFNGITPSIISYNILAPNWISSEANAAVPGGTAGTAPGESKVENPQLLSISGSYLRKIDPWTGALTGNYSIAPLSGGTYYKNEQVLNIQDLGAAAANAPGGRYRLINWTCVGTLANLTTSTGTRILSNTSYARSSLPTLADYNAGFGATVTGLSEDGAYTGITISGFNLWTGASLWNWTDKEVTQYSGSCNVADHGKIAVLTQQGYYIALDLATGKVAWKGEKMLYPWGSTAFGAYAVQSAYGMIFRQSYDAVYAFNWTDGSIVWRYEAPAFSMYETPYTGENGTTVYCFNGGGKIADGKMYVANSEHSATYPLTRGWGLHCINITTGELIWKIQHPMSAGVIADGYMTASDSNEGYMYVFGKGQSATTVTAPDVVMPKGNGVVIKGTVVDLSPAQPGTPCVSKESMTTQMEYLHLQRSIAGPWENETITGVPVALTAIGSDGSVFDLGTATSNGYSGVFSLAWTPPAEGTYEIIASFAGDESYGSSMSTTAVSVGPAPAPIQFPEQIAPTDYTMTIVYASVAIMFAVFVAVALAILILRKR